MELEMVTGHGRPMLKSDECPDRTFRAGAELVWGCRGAEVWRCGIRIGTEVRSGGAEVVGLEVRVAEWRSRGVEGWLKKVRDAWNWSFRVSEQSTEVRESEFWRFRVEVE